MGTEWGSHLAANDENRSVTDREVLHKIIAGIGKLLHPANVQPHFAENSLAFFLKIFS